MRSPESTTCRPHRHFGAVALHNCALRIIGERCEDAEHQLARRRGGVDGCPVARQHLETDAARAEVVNDVD